mmetsp:Transcript_30935/g.56670  ORF Transcript_30935/g.56670 Transcript_30935/m.56670 type:complete len:437 (+) Transcript_30935:131-1441(+)
MTFKASYGSAVEEIFEGGMYSSQAASYCFGSLQGTHPSASQETVYQAAQIARMSHATHLPAALPPGPVNSSTERTGNHNDTPVSAGGFTPVSSTTAAQHERPFTHVNSGSSSETPKESSASAISLLQEFVQCSREFRNPAKRSILHWRFDERLADAITLEFRATVAFLLDGVAHHAVGEWHTSKKLARLDVAERALILFVSLWGQQLLNQEEAFTAPAPTSPNSGNRSVAQTVREVRELEDFCRQMPVAGAVMPQWSVNETDDNKYQVTAELTLMDVPHMLQGPAMASREEAYAETAKRILWYLQCPGYEDDFEPDPYAPAATEREIPAPPKHWTNDDLDESAAQVERKTALIKVQNRVQQIYARDLKPGQKVWDWSFDYESPGPNSRCKAKVHIPVAGVNFTSDWHEVQRDAQLDVCAQVTAFLEGQDGKPDSRA